MEEKNKKSWIKSWGIILGTLFLLWSFAFVIGPWGEKNIPVFKDITKVIESDNIDSTAYMYTEIEGAYYGERNLINSLRLKQPDKTGFTLQFMTGVFSCFALLWFGYKFLPME